MSKSNQKNEEVKDLKQQSNKKTDTKPKDNLNPIQKTVKTLKKFDISGCMFNYREKKDDEE